MSLYSAGELDGALLDAAVAKAEGASVYADAAYGDMWEGSRTYRPSTDWNRGGPIIERERITTIASTCEDSDDQLEWSAVVGGFSCYIDELLPIPSFIGQRGPTPLVAAMRAYVVSKFGDEVDL